MNPDHDLNLTLAYLMAWLGLSGCLFIVIRYGGEGVAQSFRNFRSDLRGNYSEREDFTDEK